MCLGTAAAENAVAGQQASFTNTLMSQASTVFQQAQGVFATLKNAYTNIVNAGPSQPGFSAATNAALQASAVTQGAAATRNAVAGAAGRLGGARGGNVPTGGSGIGAGTVAGTEQAGAAATAANINRINLENAQQGNANWRAAGAGLQQAPSMLTKSAEAYAAPIQKGLAANMANAEAADARKNWWVKPVEAVAGAGLSFATGGLVPPNTSTGGGGAPGGGGGGGGFAGGFGNMSSDSSFTENLGNFASGFFGKSTPGGRSGSNPGSDSDFVPD